MAPRLRKHRVYVPETSTQSVESPATLLSPERIPLCQNYPAAGPGSRWFWLYGAFAILGPLGREVGMSELQISSIIAASSLVVFLASPHWGRLSDRWGRKRVMVIGLFGYACGNLLFASVFHLTLVGALLPAHRLPVVDADASYARQRDVGHHACQQRLHGGHYINCDSHQGHGRRWRGQ